MRHPCRNAPDGREPCRPLGRLRLRSHSTTSAERLTKLRGYEPLRVSPDGLKRSAVLVPLVLDPSGVQVIFTRRTDALKNHAGQVSFPGGRIDPTDASPADAALREMQEEMGVGPAHVEVIGGIDEIVTVTGYHITPIVGTLPPDVQFEPNPLEVARVLSVSLDALLDQALWQRDEREWRGQILRMWKFPHEQDIIWGATAQMLRQFMELLWR